jgi:hypothetical protein
MGTYVAHSVHFGIYNRHFLTPHQGTALVNHRKKPHLTMGLGYILGSLKDNNERVAR